MILIIMLIIAIYICSIFLVNCMASQGCTMENNVYTANINSMHQVLYTNYNVQHFKRTRLIFSILYSLHSKLVEV